MRENAAHQGILRLNHDLVQMLFIVQNVSAAAGAAIPAFTRDFMDLGILIQRAKVSDEVS